MYLDDRSLHASTTRRALGLIGLPGLLAALLGCSQPANPPETPTNKAPTPLGLLMKEQVNPSFSKLSFLLFHGDSLDDPAALAAQLRESAAILKSASARVRVWPDPPVTSQEGRDVFYALSTSVDQFADKLVASIDRRDYASAQKHLEDIAKACNDCHHFFRLKLKDSVVGPGAPPPDGM